MQNKVKDYETGILLKDKSLIDYIEKKIEKEAENGVSVLRLSLTVNDLEYVFPNNFKISYTELSIIKKSFRARGFDASSSNRTLIIDWL